MEPAVTPMSRSFRCLPRLVRLRPASLVAAALLTIASVGAVGAAGTAASVTDTPDDEAPTIQSLTISPTTTDTTTDHGLVDVEARITDATAGAARATVAATYHRDASADPASLADASAIYADLELASGTPQDGTWRGTLTVTPGTRGSWTLDAVVWDAWENRAVLSTTDLAAAGFATRFTSSTTAPPARPTVSGRSSTHIVCCYPVVVDAFVTVTRPANTPLISGLVMDSASAACGTRVIDGRLTEIEFRNRTLGSCTVKLRTVNAAGPSPQASVTFW
jgi:hypothetical protein